MEIYEVGGCVRDRLLGMEPKDIDYVVVGSSVAQMQDNGYQLVGKDFPVFIHPVTGCEYALARTERKIGAGYGGFETEVKNVTLQEDLLRRDLTINAIAMDKNGKMIDPYGGANDLAKKILRHVSQHFAEDPVRILRIARFSARYGFKIAPETYQLMHEMVIEGEFDHLTKERVWKELEKSLSEPYLNNFFKTLENVHALEKIFSFKHFLGSEYLGEISSVDARLCHIFSYCSQEEIRQWKMPEHQQKLIIDYKNHYQKDDFYSAMSPQDRLHFIMTAKAMHDKSYGEKIISLVNAVKSYDLKNNPEKKVNGSYNTLEKELDAYYEDIDSLKQIDYQALAEETDKKLIRQVRENAQIMALEKKPAIRLRF